MLPRLPRRDGLKPRLRSHPDGIGRSIRRARVFVVLVMLLSVLAFPFQSDAASPIVGPRTYYLALGDSLAFGYQPNFDWNHGYADQWFNELRWHGVQSMTNYGCPGETASTFIWGGCKHWYLQRTPYFGPQLSAAVNFIKAHPGQVSPVSLDIGANELLDVIDASTCSVDVNAFNLNLAILSFNLNFIILPQLTSALTVANHRSGDLVLMLYYNPYQNACPGSGVYVQMLNDLLAAAANTFGLRTADTFVAFSSGGPTPNPKVCVYTWMCARNDIHATGGRWGEPGNGYGVIARTFMRAVGY